MRCLVLALDAAGAVVVRVDPWVDPRCDPGSLIVDAVALALAPRLGVLSRAAKATGLESVAIAGALKIDINKIGGVVTAREGVSFVRADLPLVWRRWDALLAALALAALLAASFCL